MVIGHGLQRSVLMRHQSPRPCRQRTGLPFWPLLLVMEPGQTCLLSVGAQMSARQELWGAQASIVVNPHTVCAGCTSIISTLFFQFPIVSHNTNMWSLGQCLGHSQWSLGIVKKGGGSNKIGSFDSSSKNNYNAPMTGQTLCPPLWGLTGLSSGLRQLA